MVKKNYNFSSKASFGCFLCLLLCVIVTGCGPSHLNKAVRSNDINQARELLEKGKKPSPDELMTAVNHKNLQMVTLLIENGVDVNDSDNFYSIAPLIQAAYIGHLEIVKTLLASGADPNSKNRFGMSPLLWAAQKGYVEIAKVLIENGADIRDTDKNETSVLMAAAISGKLKIAKMLIDHGAGDQINIKSDSGTTALTNAAGAKTGSLDMVRYLCEKGADINTRNSYKKNAFQIACLYGNGDAAVYLYEKGIDTESEKDEVEINGKANHVFGDYYLSVDQYEKARQHFMEAKKNYDATIKVVEGQASWEGAKQFFKTVLVGAGTAFVSTYGSTLQRMQIQQDYNKYLSQRSREDKQLSSKIHGYSSHFSKHNQYYRPTYKTGYFKIIPSFPQNAGNNEKKAYYKAKAIQFKNLSMITEKILECFENDIDTKKIYPCISDKLKK